MYGWVLDSERSNCDMKNPTSRRQRSMAIVLGSAPAPECRRDQTLFGPSHPHSAAEMQRGSTEGWDFLRGTSRASKANKVHVRACE